MDNPLRALLLDRLLDLSYDASSYLRRHTERAVRVSAALLVAASLAACGGIGSLPIPGLTPGAAVQPLRQEVRVGLPPGPGRYPVVADSVQRDEQGVYRFSWLPAGSVTTGGTASVSRLRLGQASQSALDVPDQGDPTLYLSPDAKVALVPAAGYAGSPSGGGFGYWYPFFGGHYGGPAYYDPPSRSVSQSGTITGAHVSSAPAAPGSRTVSPPHTVSGRAGGSGNGTAASNKSGAGTGQSGGKGVGSAQSGSFSGGKGGSAGGKGGGAGGASS